MYRGSRKHVLDWVETSTFLPDLLATVAPIDAKITAASKWMPRSYREPDEARLESFGPSFLPDHPAWKALQSWWLRNPSGANTPNWDIAVGCEIEGRPGLILVEAKANVLELSDAGKRELEKASSRSRENRDQIQASIAEAQGGLKPFAKDLKIAIDSCYQLSNRIAFLRKLATLDLPTVFLYLGFCGDQGIRDVSKPFTSPQEWAEVFQKHATGVGASVLINRRLQIGRTPGWLLQRSRSVLEASPKPSSKEPSLPNKKTECATRIPIRLVTREEGCAGQESDGPLLSEISKT
jgi:hypothetical protein